MLAKKATRESPSRAKKSPAKAALKPSEATPKTTIVQSFESPESSTIVRAEFTPIGGTDVGRLVIQFKREHGTDTYAYMGVPHSLWTAFSVAESKGRYFQMAIRPLYAGRRLE